MDSSEIQCDGYNYKSGCDEVLIVYVALNLPIIFSPDIDLNKSFPLGLFPSWLIICLSSLRGLFILGVYMYVTVNVTFNLSSLLFMFRVSLKRQKEARAL